MNRNNFLEAEQIMTSAERHFPTPFTFPREKLEKIFFRSEEN